MILELFASVIITILLIIVGCSIGYVAFQYGRTGSNQPVITRPNSKRGLVVIGFNHEYRSISFYGDGLTVNRFREYGKLHRGEDDPITNDMQWVLIVSRFVPFQEVLDEIRGTAMRITPHGLDNNIILDRRRLLQ